VLDQEVSASELGGALTSGLVVHLCGCSPVRQRAHIACVEHIIRCMRQGACVFCKDHLISKRHRIDLAAVDAETAYFIADAMEGLAAGARVQLLCLLAHGPRSVKDLTAATGMEQPAVSQHLRVLRDLGFVRAEKKGRHKIYELYDAHVAGLLEQVIAHAEHLRDHLSTREESTVALSRERKRLQQAS